MDGAPERGGLAGVGELRTMHQDEAVMDGAHEPSAPDAGYIPAYAVAGGGDGAEREPELVPVAASVFDDDFFRRGRERGIVPEVGAGVAVKPAPIARVDNYELDGLELESQDSGTREFTFGGYATAGGSRPMAHEHGAPEPAGGAVAGGAMLFAGASGSNAEHAGADELDIPAFLRRGR